MSAPLHPPIPFGASSDAKTEAYERVALSIDALLEDENDWVAAMSTVVCELHHAFGYFHWTGFYRTIAPELLAVGPYQGGHGCLRIPFAKGVCGAAARTRETQLVPDVEAFPGHIACSSSTRSEIVVPLVADDRVLAVLDVDSDDPAAFDETDRRHLEALCQKLAARYG
ncbi:MAG: GAF domain-containing protein [Deltaproteobacteria bacterium]|nr:GAF domain-containing protein [Deltaproteobacteria bacterium]